MKSAAPILIVAACCALAGCVREERHYHDSPPGTGPVGAVRQSALVPGAPPEEPIAGSPYKGNAYGLSEGKRLYASYNCVGCHAHGGGGIGPALMDDKWIYGSQPQQIYSVIADGRPNGMPAFRRHVTDDQIWQIVAYVQSMSGQAPKDAAPNRDDDLAATPPESRAERLTPVMTGHR
jgi:cytochrome c oxidase cbb3-type subunit 3